MAIEQEDILSSHPCYHHHYHHQHQNILSNPSLQYSVYRLQTQEMYDSPRRMGSTGLSPAASSSSSRRLGNISNKPLTSSRPPLGGIPRTTTSSTTKTHSINKLLSPTSSSEKFGKTLPGSGSRYPNTKRIMPSGSVLLDKTVSSPRTSREYGKNGITSSSRISNISGTPRNRDSSSSDTTPGSKSPESTEKSVVSNRVVEENSRKTIPPALQLDFIKAALSGGKQVYSNQEIRQKAATWSTDHKPSNGTHTKKSRTKSQTQSSSPSSSASKTQTVVEPKQQKTYEKLKNEGFAPRGKSNELNIQIKALKKKIVADTLEEEEEEIDEKKAKSQATNSLFGY